MSKERIVFLTGATGLIGSYLLKLLLKAGNKVFCLARSKKSKSADERVIEMLRFWDDSIPESALNNLVVVEGDITYPNFGIRSKRDIQMLTSELQIIFHSAALAELRVPLDIIRKINVDGTKIVFDFALKCRQLKKINYLSTTYIVGTKMEIEFSEDMLDVGQNFHNTYEQSKYEAELLVREYLKKNLSITIFRPSMVMGDSREGKINNFRLFYEPLHFFSNEIYDKFPANVECFQNLINIDTVAKAIFTLGFREESSIYHITALEETKIGLFMKLASDYFGFKIPQLIPVEQFNFKEWTPIQRALASPFFPYFNYTTRFLSQKTYNVLKEYNFEYPSVTEDNLLRVFNYCNKEGFIKKKGKNYGYFTVD